MKQNSKKIINTSLIIIGIPMLYYIIAKIIKFMILILYNIKYHYTNEKLAYILMQKTDIGVTLAELITILLLIVIFSKTKETLFKRCNFKPIKINKIIYIIIFTIGFTFLNVIFIKITLPFLKNYQYVQQSMIKTNVSLIRILCVTILVPIFEEITFRGVIFGFLKENFSIIVAIIVQALIFAIMHGNLLQGIYAFVFGIALAIINIYSCSLYGNIIAHITFNTFGRFIIPFLVPKIPYISIFALIGFIMISFSIIKFKNSLTNLNISNEK